MQRLSYLNSQSILGSVGMHHIDVLSIPDAKLSLNAEKCIYIRCNVISQGFDENITIHIFCIAKILKIMKKINVSLDSLDKAKNAFITKRDYYDRIMQNIQEGISRGFQIKLNVVLIKGVNEKEIKDFITLTKDKNVVVKFIEFMPFKGNKWDWSKGVSEEEILNEAQRAFGKVDTLENPKHSTSNNYQVEGHKGTFGIISTITNPFCSDCNRIRLTADGKMKNCLFANSETDILGPYRNGESIDQLILATIQTKKYSRDGMELKMDADQYENNRSMISIGG